MIELLVIRSVNVFVAVVLVAAVTVVLTRETSALSADKVECGQLLPGQYVCDPPVVSAETQQPQNCTEHDTALVNCHVISNISCIGLYDGTFQKSVKCRYGPRKSFKIALLLSVFFGWLGLDRFYLGYFTIGMFKLWTCGFFFLVHLLDIILIALQVVQPADGRGYFLDYYGPAMHHVTTNNETFIYSYNY